MKKRFWGALCGVMAVACAYACVACKNGDSDTKPLGYIRVDDTVSVRFSGGKLYMRGDGARDYEVWKSSTKNGDYVKADTVAARGQYVTDDIESWFTVKTVSSTGEERVSDAFSYKRGLFGDDTAVFEPTDNDADIQNYIDGRYKRLLWDEFGEDRAAMLFMPGDYAGVTAKVGYYTTVAGVGYAPTDVKLHGLNCDNTPLGSGSLINFWRSAENFEVATDAYWHVSQATSLRRMSFDGGLELNKPGGYSSGGFFADCKIAGDVVNTTQQQWLARNSEWDNWTGVDINMVFSGVRGNHPDAWPTVRVTTLEKTSVMREKPYLVYDEDKGWGVFVSDVKSDTVGVSWTGKGTDGRFVSLNEFYIAKPDRDDSTTLNAAIENGKHLLFTPGIYYVDSAVTVNNANTVVMGMGLATLQTTQDNTDCALRIADVPGVTVCGLLIDAGSVCDTLIEVGKEYEHGYNRENPISLSDLFCRLGGHGFRNDRGELVQRNVGAETSVKINADYVIGDNFWMWRADHGMDASALESYVNADGSLMPNAAADSDYSFWRSYSVGWKGSEYGNYGEHGTVVNGDSVTIYGLMVEHYGEYQTLWNGEDGFMCFYQSETPYDAPTQQQWMSDGGKSRGYASYKVADTVENHAAYGLGVYLVSNYTGVSLDTAVEAPANSGISINHVTIARLGNNGTIFHAINDKGGSVSTGGEKRPFTSFIAGEYKE